MISVAKTNLRAENVASRMLECLLGVAFRFIPLPDENSLLGLTGESDEKFFVSGTKSYADKLFLFVNFVTCDHFPTFQSM